MEPVTLSERTILFLQTDVESTAPLQERVVQNGGRALTANSLPRALLIAENETLDDALIEFEFAGAGKVVKLLRARHIPYIFCSAESLRGLF